MRRVMDMTEGIVTRSRSKSQPLTPFLSQDYYKKTTINPSQSSSNLEAKSENTMAEKDNNQDIVDPNDFSPQKWMDMFNALNSTLGELKKDINELKAQKGTVPIDITWQEAKERELSDLDTRLDYHEHKINLLTNVMIRQDERIKFLEGKLTAVYMREIRPNLKIFGLVESKNESRENLKQAIDSFFKKTMSIEQEIEISDWYRAGQGVMRPVFIKLRHPSDKALIFSNASNLKGKQNSKKKEYFIQDEQTEEQREVRAWYRELNIENNAIEEDDKKLKIKMSRGDIVVNNSKVVQRVVPPSAPEILRLSEQEEENVRAVKLINGPEHVEKGSEYATFATRVKNENDVRKAYQKMRIKFADATHVSCGYRLENPIGPYRQQAIDDGDIGIGRSILKIMKQQNINHLAVFVVRFYGNVHLGKRRFEIAEQLTENMLHAVNKKIAQIRRKSKRHLSQASVSSVLSGASGLDELPADETQNEEPAEEAVITANQGSS